MRAISDAASALDIAQQIDTRFLVVHLGTPTTQATNRNNDPQAATRSLHERHNLTKPVGIKLTLEVIPNKFSTLTNLIRGLEKDSDLTGIGVCLDFGHACLVGNLIDEIESASEHLIATHLHDNLGSADEHLVPGDGRINWPTAMLTMQKIGCEDTLMLEVAGRTD